MEHELAYRENDGIAVTLLWDSETDRLTVTVRDWRTDEAFELTAQSTNAMDVFHHPFAYAAGSGIELDIAREAVYA